MHRRRRRGLFCAQGDPVQLGLRTAQQDVPNSWERRGRKLALAAAFG
jgi:hypothetical protein